jgi:hypothetical protein
MSILQAFTTQLVQFLDELCTTFPEEREIRMVTEAIKGTKKVNPRLLLDMFNEHVYSGCAHAIYQKDVFAMREHAKKILSSQFNEMIYTLTIFDKHWDTMSENNHKIIWQYLTVLCKLAEKA